MSFNIKIDVATGIADDLSTVTGRLQSAIETFESQSKSFFTTSSGSATNEYTTAQAVWSQRISDMTLQMQRAVQCLNQAVQEYDRADRASAGGMRLR